MSTLRIEALQNTVIQADGEAYSGLAPVNLELTAGECVCLSGISGCGKTLLMRAIADLDLSQGQVFLHDRPRDDYSGPDWRKRVTYLAAESAWWDERIQAHFPGRRIRYMEELGMDLSLLSRPFKSLSQGERQRLALLRALNRQPEVLLLDEPTASLDPDSTGKVEEIIQRFRTERGVAVLWISHDPKQIKRIADHHYQIKNGELKQASKTKAKAKRKSSATKKKALASKHDKRISA